MNDLNDPKSSLNDSTAKPASKAKPARWEKVDTNLKRYIRTGVFYIDARVQGKAICESTKTTDLAEARLIRNKRLHQAGELAAAGGDQAGARHVTVRQCLVAERATLSSYAKKQSSKEYREGLLAIIERTWPNLDQKVRTVSQSDVQEWLKRLQWNSQRKAARKTEPKRYSAQRYNRLLAQVGKFFEAAVKKGVRLDNPIDDLDRKQVAVSKALTLPTEVEFKELVEAIRSAPFREGGTGDDSADFVLFLRFTGCRIGEASRLTRANVDVKKWQLNIPGSITKNGEPRSVPVVEPLRGIIARWLEGKARGEFLTPTVDCRKAIANACKRLGLAHLTPHDLRHLFITSCIELGFRAVDIAPWVGHRDNGALILKTYTQVRDKHQNEQAALLNEKLTALAAGKLAA